LILLGVAQKSRGKSSKRGSPGKREEGRGKREEGRGKREEGRGKREEGRAGGVTRGPDDEGRAGFFIGKIPLICAIVCVGVQGKARKESAKEEK